MTIACKHLDPLIGIDTHIILIPTPAGPVPTPLPHPYVGMVLDPMDYVPIMGATTYINSLPRGQAGSSGQALPPHIPMGGPFAKPPSNESEIFMGSATVVVDDEPQSFLGLPVLSCQDIGMPAPPRPKKKSVAKSLMLPTTVVLCIPMGSLVMIGGPPTISMSAMAMKIGMAALGKLAKKFKKGKGKKLKGKNKKCTRPGHPIDPVSGANCEETVDYAAPEGLFSWERYYDSSRAKQQTTLGRGFRHSFDWDLKLNRAGAFLTTGEGALVEFPRDIGQPYGGQVDGYVLTQIDARRFSIKHGPELFYFERAKPNDRRAFLVRRNVAGVGTIDLTRGPDGSIGNLVEYTSSGNHVSFLLYDDRGRLIQVLRGPQGQSPKPVATYRYDNNDCLIEWTDALGYATRFTYDAGARVATMTTRTGYTFSFRYDEVGRCVEETGQDGLWHVQLRYEPGKTTVTEADGFDWLYLYDQNGTVTQEIDPLGGTDQTLLDDEGQVLAEIDPAGRETEWLYDDEGFHYARRDAWQNLQAPADANPNPPNPLEHVVPDTHLLQQWGMLPAEPNPSAPRSLLYTTPPDVQRLAQQLLPPTVDPNRKPVRVYDAQGRCVEETDVLGRTQRYQYDGEGNIVGYWDRDGRLYQSQITSWNLLGTAIDPLGSVTQYEYSPREEITKFTDPNGNVSTYEYDFRDRLTKVHRHGALREEYLHAPGDEVTEKRDDQGKPLVEYAIGALGLQTEAKLASGDTFTYQYDALGQFTEASNKKHQVELETDELDQPVLDERDGKGTHHLYAGAELISSAYLGRFSVGYRRKGPGTLEVRSPDGAWHLIRWDNSGLVSRQLPNGTTELSAYDSDERCLARFSWKSKSNRLDLQAFRCTYSGEGDLLRLDDTRRGTTLYEYDVAHRVIAEQPQQGARRDHAYDRGGNLLALPTCPTLGYAPGNRLGVAGTDRFEHDARQRIAKWHAANGVVAEFVYDSLDMLIEVRWSNRPDTFSAGYDGLGRRIFKQYGKKRTEFYWDGDRLAAEIAPDRRVRVYVYPSADALVPFMFVEYESLTDEPASGKPYYLFTNQAGLPLTIEDSTGNVVWRAQHVDAYGSVTLDPANQIAFALRWPGHYFDDETGLHCNRYRYYHPALGRYFQPDPLGIAGGENLYAYAANPLVDIDILGLHKTKAKKGKAKGSTKKKPPKEKLKTGEVDSYRNQKKKSAGKHDRDHIPAFQSVLAKVNAERARMRPPKKALNKSQRRKLKDNLTTVAVPRDVHKKGRTYGGKGGQTRVKKDAGNLEQAATDDLAAHRDNLKKKGHSDEDIDAWEDAVHQRNRDQGVYDKPTNPALYE